MGADIPRLPETGLDFAPAFFTLRFELLASRASFGFHLRQSVLSSWANGSELMRGMRRL
jgi:hypothetical protein